MSKIKASDLIEIDEKFIDELARKLKDNGIDNSENKTYSTREVAKIVKMDIQTIRRHIDNGLLIAKMHGKRYTVTHENLMKYLNE